MSSLEILILFPSFCICLARRFINDSIAFKPSDTPNVIIFLRKGK